MIVVKYQYLDNLISKVEVKGHADYSHVGTDIVCAAVSTLVTMTINYIDKFENIENIKFTIEDGFAQINALNDALFVQKALELLIESLKGLTYEYKSYIKIMEV